MSSWGASVSPMVIVACECTQLKKQPQTVWSLTDQGTADDPVCPRTALHLGIFSYIWGPGLNLGQPAPFHSVAEDEMGVQVSSRQGINLSLPEPGIKRCSDLINPLTPSLKPPT